MAQPPPAAVRRRGPGFRPGEDAEPGGAAASQDSEASPGFSAPVGAVRWIAMVDDVIVMWLGGL